METSFITLIAMKLRILSTDLRIQNMRLRMPFRFGIVTLTECPHLFCRALLEVDGRRTWGISADSLPNKWFTKDPAASYRDDIADMLKVINSACEIAVTGGTHDNLFDLWERTYQAEQAWAGGWGFPPLLAGFGTSLIERAGIDAFCHDQEVPFSRVLRDNRLGIRLGRIHEELSGAKPLGSATAATASTGYGASHGRPDRSIDGFGNFSGRSCIRRASPIAGRLHPPLWTDSFQDQVMGRWGQRFGTRSRSRPHHRRKRRRPFRVHARWE